MEPALNEVIRILLKCAYWLVDQLPGRIQSRVRPTLDDWTHRYMLHLIRHIRRDIARLRTSMGRQRDVTRRRKKPRRSHDDSNKP